MVDDLACCAPAAQANLDPSQTGGTDHRSESFNPNASFYDLYGGVGLFGICFYDLVRNVVLIEENIHAVAMSRYNSGYHQMERFETIAGKVEEQFLPYLESSGDENAIAMIDPPRSGLAAGTIDVISTQAKIKNLLYLSCNPEALVRDLSLLVKSGWHIKKVVPFDFFPRTRHLETLAFLGLTRENRCKEIKFRISARSMSAPTTGRGAAQLRRPERRRVFRKLREIAKTRAPPQDPRGAGQVPRAVHQGGPLS